MAAVGTALLAGKMRVPARRAGDVPRPRLAERLAAAWRTPLTVLSAPAGFGKSTLVTQWLAAVPNERVAWVALDEGDNDPRRFWTYVITALQQAVDGIGATALDLLASSSVETALAPLLNELTGLPADLLLVLDDYHLVESAEIHESMAYLLDHQPPQLHVVLTTRTDPPLPLARMRARGQIIEVRAADLRFTADECAAYLNGAMGLALTDADVTALGTRTEGWIAALQLAALSLSGRADASAFIAGFAGDDRYVVDYLVEEVLARQSSEVRDFLLNTSVLERLTGPLCDAVTGSSGSTSTLVALDHANLFLIPLDDRRQWYRYHHLFADVLRAHLREERPDQIADLHRRASNWFEDEDDASEAVRHALAAGEPERAADLMERAMPVVQRERRETELRRWVRSLPDDVVRVRPVLGVAFVGALAQASEFGTVAERLAVVERSVRADDGTWAERPPPGLVVVDENAYRSVPGNIEMFRAALSLMQGDLDGTGTHARAAIDLAPSDDHLTRAAAAALGGLASWTRGDLAGAHAAYSQAVAGLERAGFIPDVLGCSITLGDIRRTQGRLGDAVRTYESALALAASRSGAAPVRGTADMHVGIAGVLVERNDLAAAREHLELSHRLGEYNGLPQNPYRWRLVTARLREAEGDLDEALALLDEADRCYDGDYSPNVRPVPAVRARLRIRRGELNHASDWAAQAQLSGAADVSYLREYELLTLARLRLAQHAAAPSPAGLDETSGLLDRLLVAAEAGGRDGSVLEVLLLKSLVQQLRADLPAALTTLHRAIELAEAEGYVRLFADEGRPMAALLKALAKRSAPSGYVRRLLAATAADDGRPDKPGGLVEPLSERELDVLRLLGTDLDGPDIARELSVSLNTMRTHTKNIYAKLGVSSRRAAVRQAQELDLLPSRNRR